MVWHGTLADINKMEREVKIKMLRCDGVKIAQLKVARQQPAGGNKKNQLSFIDLRSAGSLLLILVFLLYCFESILELDSSFT